jgi:hypothetical protein
MDPVSEIFILWASFIYISNIIFLKVIEVDILWQNLNSYNQFREFIPDAGAISFSTWYVFAACSTKK